MPAKLSKIGLMASCVLCLLALASGSARAQGALMGTVGGVPITRYEVNRESFKLLPLAVSFHAGVSAEKKAEVAEKAFESLADRARKVRWALESGLNYEKGSLEKLVADVHKRFKTPAELEKALAGETMEELEASMGRELLARVADDRAVISKAKVSEQDVQSYYDQHKDSYKRPRQFEASHVLIEVKPSASEADRAKQLVKAKDIAARAKKGEDFYNLAYYNSDDRTKWVGGSLGVFHEGQAAEEFEAALLKMSPGEISDVVETMYGFHVIKLVRKDEPKELAFGEVKDKIRTTLVEGKKKKLRDAWMKGLRARYPLERVSK